MRQRFTDEMVGFIQLERPMKTRTVRPVQCRICRGRQVKATSSQQMLKVRGEDRLHAEAICKNRKCKHTWWSRNPAVLEMARTMDAKRKKH